MPRPIEPNPDPALFQQPYLLVISLSFKAYLQNINYADFDQFFNFSEPQGFDHGGGDVPIIPANEVPENSATAPGQAGASSVPVTEHSQTASETLGIDQLMRASTSFDCIDIRNSSSTVERVSKTSLEYCIRRLHFQAGTHVLRRNTCTLDDIIFVLDGTIKVTALFQVENYPGSTEGVYRRRTYGGDQVLRIPPKWRYEIQTTEKAEVLLFEGVQHMNSPAVYSPTTALPIEDNPGWSDLIQIVTPSHDWIGYTVDLFPKFEVHGLKLPVGKYTSLEFGAFPTLSIVLGGGIKVTPQESPSTELEMGVGYAFLIPLGSKYTMEVTAETQILQLWDFEGIRRMD